MLAKQPKGFHRLVPRTRPLSPLKPMATSLASIHGTSSQIRHARPNHRPPVLRSPATIRAQVPQESQPQGPNDGFTILHTSRRTSIGLAVATLFDQVTCGASLAEEENNGFWYTGRYLPAGPTVINDIANKETGTRSFLKKGLFMPKLDIKSSRYRIRMLAFDLLALGDMLGDDTLNFFWRYLRVKSTSMYYEFDKVITEAADDQKTPLLDLANRLFDSVEKLEDAARMRSGPLTRSSYAETQVILKEVMTRMA